MIFRNTGIYSCNDFWEQVFTFANWKSVFQFSDATDVFVSLIAQKYSQRNNKEYLAKKQDLEYNKDKVQSDRVPSGLCG